MTARRLTQADPRSGFSLVELPVAASMKLLDAAKWPARFPAFFRCGKEKQAIQMGFGGFGTPSLKVEHHFFGLRWLTGKWADSLRFISRDALQQYLQQHTETFYLAPDAASVRLIR